MHNTEYVRAALRELDEAQNPKPEAQPVKSDQTDWKSLDDRTYRAEMAKQFGVHI